MSKQVTQAQREAAIESLEAAYDQLSEVIHTLTQVANDLDDDHARCYLVAHLRCMADHTHGYLSRDFTVRDWIENLEQEQEIAVMDCES